MTLDNMTGITEGSYTGFCKSQLITCNRVKECNGVCPFEDALKHADKEMDEQTVINHDRDWIIGCIQHDGFIHTHRFDKANQIILDALSDDTSSDLISRANAIRWVKTECNQYGKPTLDYDSGLKVIEHLKKMPSELLSAEQGWIPFTRRPMTEEEQKDYPNCTFMFDCVLPDDGDEILVSNRRFVWMDTFCSDIDGCYLDSGDDIDEDMAWMPLPEPYKEADDEN